MPEIRDTANQTLTLAIIALAVFMAILGMNISSILLPAIIKWFYTETGYVSEVDRKSVV